ncbi:MAG TPA: tetratricopeptide repeat protein [Thermoleophilaceae bacterium]|nr:tetratricopeptide repeat protein [Thermoleophilaceae bacterium]
MASAFARVALGFLRDCRAGRLGPFDPSRPIDFVELGAGPGHFAFLFAESLVALKAAVPELAPLRVRCVMTDLAETNVAAWRSRPALAALAARGVVDFATLDAERGGEVVLRVSGETLRAGEAANPTFAVASYLFDSLAQDLFWIEGKQLLEAALSLQSSQAEDLEGSDPGLLSRLELRYEPRPVALPYYGDAALDGVLEAYRERLGNGGFLLPVGAIAAVRNARRLLGPRLVLLAADKGEVAEGEVLSRGTPQLTLHRGCFSLGVNFHALSRVVEQEGGEMLSTVGHDRRLRVVALLQGAAGEAFAETRLAFQDAVARFSPLDYFALSHHVRGAARKPPLDVALALLRLGEGDARLFVTLAGAIAERCADAPSGLRRDLLREMQRAAARFFPMSDDLPFELGRVAARLGRPLEALRFFVQSMRQFGTSPATLFNAALCLRALGERDEALRLLERALELEPSFAAAGEWRDRLRSEAKAG